MALLAELRIARDRPRLPLPQPGYPGSCAEFGEEDPRAGLKGRGTRKPGVEADQVRRGGVGQREEGHLSMRAI